MPVSPAQPAPRQRFNLAINGELILTTPDHPFFTDTLEQIPAGHLQVGDRLWQGDLGYGVVEAVVVVSQPQLMYNLSVDEAHTFFVGDGSWLVHNICKFSSRRGFKNRVNSVSATVTSADIGNGTPTNTSSREWVFLLN